MLVRISIENFKSFDKESVLTMISSDNIRTSENHRLKIKNVHLLKYAAVYGENASGKTNLVDFFKFFKNSVCNGMSIEATHMFCKNRIENENRESRFEIQITIGDKFYAYGFSTILSKRQLTGEWLYELYQDGSAKLLFEREGNNRPILNEEITLSLSTIEKDLLETCICDFEENEMSLFLTKMNRGKKYSTQSRLIFFQDVYDWIQNNILIITQDTSIINLEEYYNENTLETINRLIKTLDIGIDQVKIEKITLNELSNKISKAAFDDMMQHVENELLKHGKIPFNMTIRTNEIFLNVEVEGNSELKFTIIRLYHDKSFYYFEFVEESDEIKRLFDLMDILLNKRQDILYIVDELERSLHPKLVEKFLQLVTQECNEKYIQLFFTTHNPFILRKTVFRKDEIWFVERDEKNTSSIYSLNCFKKKFDRLLVKLYLKERYIAIPSILPLDFREEE